MAVEQYYDKLPANEGDDEDSPLQSTEKQRTHVHTKSSRRTIILSFLTGALLAAFLSAVVGTTYTKVLDHKNSVNSTAGISNSTVAVLNHTSEVAAESKTEIQAPLDIKGCGSNPAEARALGCIYDVMMQLWMHPDCYDGALSEKYLAANNWTWYADPSATRIYTDEEIRKGEHPYVFVAQDYHKKHCIFAWEKLVRAMRNEAPLIQELISYDHVMHCRMKTLAKEADHIFGVQALTGFTRCASYETWTQALPGNEHSSTD